MALFRNLGPFRTTAIGHGEMPLTIENNRGHDVGIETLHASLDAGCRHIDTAWAYYTPGEEEQTGEKLVREALDSWKGPREEVTVQRVLRRHQGAARSGRGPVGGCFQREHRTVEDRAGDPRRQACGCAEPVFSDSSGHPRYA